VQTGFGPFFSVYLTEQDWTQGDIGLALSIGTASVLIFQLPSGALVDHIRHKRFAIALGIMLIAASAMMLVAEPTPWVVWSSQIVHAIGSCILGPSIAALTLALTGQTAFGERIGINARYASLGGALAAALFGALAYYLSNRAVFLATALLCVPAIATLRLFRDSDRVPEDDHPALLTAQELRQRKQHPWHIFGQPALHVFAVCAVLFNVANAAMLPLALNELAKRTDDTGFVVSAAIIVPQVVVALCSPWAGRLAQVIGRKPILLVGFVAGRSCRRAPVAAAPRGGGRYRNGAGRRTQSCGTQPVVPAFRCAAGDRAACAQRISAAVPNAGGTAVGSGL
jgi:MFS family permease